jgi:hypothetical protein
MLKAFGGKLLGKRKAENRIEENTEVGLWEISYEGGRGSGWIRVVYSRGT